MAGTEQLDPEVAALSAQVTQANAGGRAPLAVVPDGLDPDVAAFAKRVADQEPPRVSPTKMTIEPQPGWNDTWKGITGNLVGGSYGAVKEAASGLAISGGLSDFKTEQKKVEDDVYLRAQTDAEDYANAHGHDILSTIIGGGVHVLPMAGIGLGATGLGTLAALPISGPLAPFVGLAFGALTMGTLAAGQGIYQHMKQGWTKEHAIAGGLLSGAVAAGMQFVGMGATEKAGADTLETIASSPAFRQAITETVGHISKAIGINVALSAPAAISESVADYLLASKPKNMQQALTATAEMFYEGSLSGVIPAALIGGGAAAMGIHARMQATTEHIEALRRVIDLKTQEIHQKQVEAEAKLETLKDSANKLEANAESRGRTLKGRVEETEAEAQTAREGADNSIKTADETRTSAAKAEQTEQQAAVKLHAALINQQATEHHLAEFGPATFDDEARWKFLQGKAEIEATEDQQHAEDIQAVRDELEQAEGHFNELRERAARKRSAKKQEPARSSSKPLKEAEEMVKRLEAQLAFLEENFSKQRELEPTRGAVDAANQAFRLRVQEKIKTIKAVRTADAAKVVAAGEVDKSQIRLLEAHKAEAEAAGARVDEFINDAEVEAARTDLEGQIAEQQKVVDAIPNRQLSHAERRVITRAGLAIKTAAGAGIKVLDVLAKTGDYDEAAKALINHEPISEPMGEANKLRRANIFKDTAGLNLDGLLRYVFQHAPPEEQEVLRRALSINEASNEAENKRMIYQKLADTYVKEAIGLDDEGLTKLMHTAAITKVEGKWSDGRTITAPDNYGNDHTMSVDEAMSYLLWAENSDAQAALYSPEGNNFPRDFEITLTEEIGKLPDGQKYLDALDGFRGFYAEMGSILKEVHDGATGGDLPLQKNHGGTIQRVGHVRAAMDQISATLPGQEYVANGHATVEAEHRATFERGALTTAIAKRGAFASSHSHAVVTGNYEANVNRAPFWEGFVNNPVVVSGIVEKFGEPTLDMVRNRYRDQVHGVPAAMQGSIEWIDQQMRANRTSVLGANPIYTIQHWFTLLNFFLARDHEGTPIPFSQLGEGFLHFMLNKDEAASEVMSWDSVKARYDDSNTIGGIVRGEQTPDELNYEKNALKWFRKGDMPALEAGTYAVFHTIYSRTGDYELAKATATQAFHDCLASGSSQQWTELTTNKILKLFSAFEQPAIRLRQHSFEAKLRANNFPTAANFQDQLRTEIVARTAATAFLQPKLAVALADAAVLGNPNGLISTALRIGTTLAFGNMLPVTHVIGEAALAGMTGAHFDPDLQTPVARGVIGGAKAVGIAAAMATGHTPFSLHHVLQSMIGAYQGATLLGKGKPVAPMIWLDRILGGK